LSVWFSRTGVSFVRGGGVEEGFFVADFFGFVEAPLTVPFGAVDDGFPFRAPGDEAFLLRRVGEAFGEGLADGGNEDLSAGDEGDFLAAGARLPFRLRRR